MINAGAPLDEQQRIARIERRRRSGKKFGRETQGAMINAAIVGLGRRGQNHVNSVQGESARLRFVRGVILHVEGHFSNEHALKKLHYGWRESPDEAPGGRVCRDSFTDLWTAGIEAG